MGEELYETLRGNLGLQKAQSAMSEARDLQRRLRRRMWAFFHARSSKPQVYECRAVRTDLTVDS